MSRMIEIRNLSKKYSLGQRSAGYTALRDIIAEATANPLKTLRRQSKKLLRSAPKDEFWALKDINLTINEGEVVGIVGANGAGKSTLLKILSRITPPTSGEVRLAGRVGSLLEVGTGFHPELSGRENVFLNGSILGMSRQEIAKKFDDIVEFAGIERFLDTPVKRYSSGMYVRLAFSVAAHLEPDILIVDEVLAVGDAEFQKRCLGKMEEATRQQGRTILFVSHNMSAIRQLCQKAALLEHGTLTEYGPTSDTIERYLHSIESASAVSLAERKDRKGSQKIRCTKITCHDLQGEPLPALRAGEPVEIRVEFEVRDPSVTDFDLAIGINALPETYRLGHLMSKMLKQSVDAKRGTASFIIDRLPLNVGSYSFMVFLDYRGHILDWVQDAYLFQVDPGEFYPSGNLPTRDQGPILFDYRLH